ncbi:MAG: T9SS type A sorting domain-containing protein [Rhodothermales bacterium]|nr:T9SS type A sorting domain-containing protein [Rhodothermales bacterium]
MRIMPVGRLFVCAASLSLVLAGMAAAQPINVTFRYVQRPDLNFVRVYNPGDFNNWGNNSAGRIPVGDPSQFTYDAELDEYVYTKTLLVGASHQYKLHFQFNDSGSDWAWFADFYNDRIFTGNNDGNSLVTIKDPMVFQPAGKISTSLNEVERISVGVFGTAAVTAITFEINEVPMDGMPFFDAGKRVFQYTPPSPLSINSTFKLIATDAMGRSDSVSVGDPAPIVVDEPAPPGVRDGVTMDDADPSRVTLALFAPGKNFVHVIGDFNNWEVSDDFLMKRDSINADSIRWWLTLDGLTPGQEYGYQYLVDNQIRVADPYATKLLDPSHDGFLASVYPGLKAYPTGETTQMVGVFKTGESAFNWAPFERPEQKDLVIYEMLIRDFISNHDYATLIDTLDYIERLGVNAIELMPVAEFDGNDSWGYNPAFHLAPDKYYGPPEDLKRFVDECHQRGIAVILDVVYNHATGQSPLIRLYNASQTGDPSAPPNSNSIYANTTARHPFNVFNDLNHESTATKYWLDRASEYWLEEFNVDGFRFDLSKGFTQVNSTDDSVMRLYDTSRIQILKRMADQLWAVDSTAYVILEHFAEDREERELAEYGIASGRPGMMLWNNKHSNYSEAAMGYHGSGKSNFASVYYGTGGRGWTVPNIVSYMESHDEQWLMFKNLAFGACTRSITNHLVCAPSDPLNFGTYNVRQLNTALDRMKMAGAFFFTLPGPKMMWQFGELGYGYGPDGRECLRPGDELGDCPAGTPSRTGRKPIRWDYRNDPLRERLYGALSAIINLRMNHEVFSSTQTNVELSVSSAVKRIKLSHPTMNVVILGNFGVTPANGTPAFHHPGTWFDFFTGADVPVADASAPLLLAPGEFHIYTNRPVETPESGLITVDVEQEPSELPQAVEFASVYPNPFSGVATLRFALPAPGSAKVEVFDILGRRVAVPVAGRLPAGNHEILWDATDQPSGAYLVRLQSDGVILNRTVVHLR